MDKGMNKIASILFFLAMPFALPAQEIVVQSTDREDLLFLTQYKNSPEIMSAINKLKAVIGANPDYAGKNMNVVVKVTFRNPATNIMNLKRDEIYSDTWIAFPVNAGNKITLNFSFEEKSAGNAKEFTFTDFNCEESGGGEQVPEVVARYIQDQILRQQNNDVEKIIKKGLNAVKNAFDGRFQRKMINAAGNLLAKKNYYKGYTYVSDNYYTIESEINTNVFSYDFCTVYAQIPNAGILPISPQSPFDTNSALSSILSQKNSFVYSAPDGQHISFKPALDDIYVKNNQNTFVKYTETGYTKENYVYSENNATYILNAQSHINSIIENPYVYSRWERQKINRKWTQGLVFDGTLYYCKQEYRVVYRKGIFAAAEQIDEKRGISRWPDFEYGQPTWCNQFARDLTKEMYGGYIIKSVRANALFDSLSVSDDFVSLMDVKKNNENDIWKNYVDKGYLVFYSKKESGKSGHIETCFPNKILGNKTNQNRHSEDTRYPGKNTPKPAGSDKNLFVGAGNTVGYKNQQDWRNKEDTTPFLYLGFLKLEIN